MACLGVPCPSPLLLNQSVFVQDPVYLWTAAYRKEEMNTSPSTATPPRLAIPGDTCKILVFTFSAPLPLCPVKEPGSQTQTIRYFETSVCHLLSQLACQTKSYSLLQHLVSDLLACHAVSRPSSDSATEQPRKLETNADVWVPPH